MPLNKFTKQRSPPSEANGKSADSIGVENEDESYDDEQSLSMVEGLINIQRMRSACEGLDRQFGENTREHLEISIDTLELCATKKKFFWVSKHVMSGWGTNISTANAAIILKVHESLVESKLSPLLMSNMDSGLASVQEQIFLSLTNLSKKIWIKGIRWTQYLLIFTVLSEVHLLFLIFINDKRHYVSPTLSLNYLLYAEDLTLFIVIKVEEDCEVLNVCLNRICDWCNYMAINIRLFLDPKHILKCDDHVEQVISRSIKILDFLDHYTRGVKNIHVWRTFYCALVRPILEYDSFMWNPF
ncbi:hypothetical protein J437_LFUL006581 [Ladona fulva]|uniref:Uncharacterized protein n=1 Tax=Ladona fulva TaxID=123851 RepID=A0A8K0K399_LADFU|nr:hypothetical protein J437_LFUL006581 [Ladona fulva]